jgi:uncharacterized membrane protein
MAAGTYGIRAGGLWLARRITPSPLVESFLGHLPGAMFVALIVPAILRGGPAYLIAALATILVMRASGVLALALAAGVATVLLLRL